MEEDPGKVDRLMRFLWNNRVWFESKIVQISNWFSSDKKDSTGAEGSILIIGPGGVGKSTAARLLSTKEESLSKTTPEYVESINIERLRLGDDTDVELVVPPGQDHRRDSTWKSLEQGIATGEYRGIINLVAYGYHSLHHDYRGHRLFKGDTDQFVSDYTDLRRNEEVAVIKRLSPYLKICHKKMWLMTLVTKEDLWTNHKGEVRAFYKDDEFGKVISEIKESFDSSAFRYEFVTVSLIINRFTAGSGQVLVNNAAGYDQHEQVLSWQRFMDTLLSLKEWEEKRC